MKKTIKHIGIMTHIGIFLLCVSAVSLQSSSTAYAVTDCIVSKPSDDAKMDGSPASLRSAINAFNLVGLMQFCRSIKINVPKITLTEAKIIYGDNGPADKFILDGNGSTIDGAQKGENGCTITILSSNVEIKNLNLVNGGICIGSDSQEDWVKAGKKDGGVTKNVKLANVTIEKSPKDGLLIAKHSAEVNIGKGTKIVYSGQNGIHYLGNHESLTTSADNIFFTTDSKLGDSASLFMNNPSQDKDASGNTYLNINVEGDSYVINNLKFNTTSIVGDIHFPDANLAKDTYIAAYLTNTSACRTEQKPDATGALPADPYGSDGVSGCSLSTTFIGVSDVQTGGHFRIPYLSSITINSQTKKEISEGDVITLVPFWTIVPAPKMNDDGDITEVTSQNLIFGSSTQPLLVKFTDTASNNVIGGMVGSGGSGGGNNNGGQFTPTALPGVKHYVINGEDKYIFVNTNTGAPIRNPIDACEYVKQMNQDDISNNLVTPNVDTDLDGIPDIKEDRNFNCTRDSGESDPYAADIDNDGLSDKDEVGTLGYMQCFKVLDSACKESDKCQSKVSPIDHKPHMVQAFDVTLDNIQGTTVPCTDSYLKKARATCQKTENYIRSIDGYPNGFDPQRGDFCINTNPTKSDSDNDGIDDGVEVTRLVYNKYAPAHLYWVNNPTAKALDEDCSAELNNQKNLTGQMLVQRKITVKLVTDEATKATQDVPLTLNLVCRSDSLQATEMSVDPYASFTIGTNPLSPDTDDDGFCDGQGGSGCVKTCDVKKEPNCVSTTMSSDNCPTIQDSSNVCNQKEVCNARTLWTHVSPEKIDDLINTIANYDGKGGRDGLMKQLRDIDAKGDVGFDTDKDGIPDIIEIPSRQCSLEQDIFFTDPFKTDTDSDQVSDSVDTFPRDSLKKVITDMSASSDCAQVIDYSLPSHMASYCFLDWDADGLYNCDENMDGNKLITHNDANYQNNETCPTTSDSDGDKLIDSLERQFKTNPWFSDTDSDGMSDESEVSLDGNPSSLHVQLMNGTVGCFNPSADGIPEIALPLAGDTDPTLKDTDADGILDGVEIKDAHTNPLNPDSDGDGLCDGNVDVPPFCIAGENLKLGKDYPHYPLTSAEAANVDTLNQYLAAGFDAWDNGMHASNPCSADTDHDGLPDYVKDGKGNADPVKNNPNKNAVLVSRFGPDTDGDGIPNDIEIDLLGTDPVKADSDSDGLEDGCIKIGTLQMRGELCPHLISNHPDFNGLGKGPGKDFNRTMGDTDPLNPDTDFDGMKDGDELAYPDGQLKSPYTKNDKGDLVFVGFYQKGVNLNPLKEDSDGDGILDGIEAGARFKSDGIGVCRDNFCCYLSGLEAVKAGNLDPVFAANPTYVEGATTNALIPDTDGDELQDGSQVTSYQPRNNWGEDLNCNGVVDKDKDGNLTESNPLFSDSNHDGVPDKDAVCRNGICDPSINMGYVYARQAGSGCTNTLMPGATLPATAGDVATLVMLLAPLGVAIRMRMRRGK